VTFPEMKFLGAASDDPAELDRVETLLAC
jgi:hypothetical protein